MDRKLNLFEIQTLINWFQSGFAKLKSYSGFGNGK